MPHLTIISVISWQSVLLGGEIQVSENTEKLYTYLANDHSCAVWV